MLAPWSPVCQLKVCKSGSIAVYVSACAQPFLLRRRSRKALPTFNWRTGGVSRSGQYPAPRLALLLILAITLAVQVEAEPTAKQARKLISRAAGMELRTGAIRIKGLSSSENGAAEAVAEIEIPFRLEGNDQGQWRVAEIRTGKDSWEAIGMIAAVVGAEIEHNDCNAPGLTWTGPEPSPKRARCLIASLMGVQLPSDEVRVKDISSLAVPLTSQPSAVVVAVVEARFRFSKAHSGQWQASEIKTGNRRWISMDMIGHGVQAQKAARARTELERVVKALEAFRLERGFYVVADSEAVLVDHLSPRYLAPVIRVDPWRHPYKYSGESDHFTLRSLGPDGKENTADDIVLTSP